MLATDYQYLQDNASGVAEYMEEQMRLSIDHPTNAAPPILDLVTVHRTGRRGRPRLEINPDSVESALEPYNVCCNIVKSQGELRFGCFDCSF
jgi:hypothetical protein